MFGELISLVDLLRGGAVDASAKKAAAKRREAVLPMLETYFLLKDLVDEGAALVTDAGPQPVAKIQTMSDHDAEATLAAWDVALKRQAFRMRAVSQLIFGQEFLEVVSPELREKLYAVVGSKFSRATSLHGIGAALFFRAIFPVEKSDLDRARYIAVMAGENGEILNMEKAEEEISQLREGLETYRAVVMKLASADEVMSLSAEARKRTDLSGTHGKS
ncbi:MAG: hypothetical protein RBR29_08150 [Castellaniella sp.]|uniref:hypothetical protein n=1 Tax=Castellaniella sp. TaxID=1955812 RepID=UPI002A35AE57|nr:hypothetical protein [Castellaniella sp.]MDY0309746.1 hypothetical protein [Castellaniella sp.]